MTLYSMYIFNRYGDCIFCKQWKQSRPMKEGEAGLVAGFVYTLQHISSQLSTMGTGGLKAVHTPFYKLHYLETLTGYRVALLTDKLANTSTTQKLLVSFMTDVFNRYVTKCPTYRHAQGVTITTPDFEEGVETFFKDNKML